MKKITISHENKNGKRVACINLRKFGRGRLYFENDESAEIEKKRLETELLTFGMSGLDFTVKDRMELWDARDRLKPFNASVRQAVDFYIQHHNAAETSTLRNAIDAAYWAKVAANNTDIYTNKFKCNLNLFADGREFILVSKITRDDVERWLFKNMWSSWTRKGRLTDLRTLFQFCLKKNWCLKCPCVGIEDIKTEDTAPGILSVEQIKKLLDAALTGQTKKGHKLIGTLPYLILGTFCGLRPSEVNRTTWDKVNTARGFVDVQNRKLRSRKSRYVTLHPVALHWLALCDKIQTIKPKNFNRRMALLMKLAEITEWPHDCLRHSFASYHYAKFGDANKTASEMGHKSSDMLFTNYRNRVTPEEAEAFWNIGLKSAANNPAHPVSP